MIVNSLCPLGQATDTWRQILGDSPVLTSGKIKWVGWLQGQPGPEAGGHRTKVNKIAGQAGRRQVGGSQDSGAQSPGSRLLNTLCPFEGTAFFWLCVTFACNTCKCTWPGAHSSGNWDLYWGGYAWSPQKLLAGFPMREEHLLLSLATLHPTWG